MKYMALGGAILLSSVLFNGCAPTATVKQVGASNKKSYYTRNVPNARTGKYKPKGI